MSEGVSGWYVSKRVSQKETSRDRGSPKKKRQKQRERGKNNESRRYDARALVDQNENRLTRPRLPTSSHECKLDKYDMAGAHGANPGEGERIEVPVVWNELCPVKFCPTCWHCCAAHNSFLHPVQSAELTKLTFPYSQYTPSTACQG